MEKLIEYILHFGNLNQQQIDFIKSKATEFLCYQFNGSILFALKTPKIFLDKMEEKNKQYDLQLEPIS